MGANECKSELEWERRGRWREKAVREPGGGQGKRGPGGGAGNVSHGCEIIYHCSSRLY